MSLLPIFVKLKGRRVLVAGAGTVAFEKIKTLLASGARVRIVAPDACEEVRALALQDRVEWVVRGFAQEDLENCTLAIAATDSPEVNVLVWRAAVDRRILCSSVDDIPHCDFYFGSIVRRGELQIAISTHGESPALSQRLRREIDAALPEDLGSWLRGLGDLRRLVLELHPAGEQRKQLLHRPATRQSCDSIDCPTRLLAIAGLADNQQKTGKVYLAGAGPGDPELLTVKALRVLQSADVVLHDDLVPQTILSLARPEAEVVNVGKRCGAKHIDQNRIHRLMIDYARRNQIVVRLKCGDPVLYGRAVEEMDALIEAGISYEVIPGVTAASAAAVAAGCALTDRTCASSLIVSTGHQAHPRNGAMHSTMENATRVVYMPGRDLTQLAEEWLDQGLPPELPCVIVSRASQPDQTVTATTLGELAQAPLAPAPSVLLAGWAARKCVTNVEAADLLSLHV